MKRYTKDDVEKRYENGTWVPAVNVKIHKGLDSVKLPLELGSSYPVGHPELIETEYTHAGFNMYWIEHHIPEDTVRAFWDAACEDGYEQAKSEFEDIFGFGASARLWGAGRSGGWIIAEGMPDIDEWDAVMLAKWRKFERICKALKDDVPRQTVESLYINVYDTEGVTA